MRRMPLVLVLVTLTVSSPAPAAAAPLPFGVVMQPRLSGNTFTPRVGETLTEINAVYNRMPKSVAYSWLRCAPGQSIAECAAVPGGDARSYTLQPSDVGFQMVVAETGSSASGATSVGVSPGTPPVQPANGLPIPPAPEPPPLPLSYPRVSGTAYLGDTLTAVPGTWSAGNYTLSYQWLQCGFGGCAPIAGATGLSYTVTEADLRYLIAVQAEATAAGGISYSLGPQLYARRLPATKELLREALDTDEVSARALLKRGVRSRFVPPAAGTVTVTWTTRRTGVRVGRGSVRCGPGHARITIPFRFTRRGRALLRRRPSTPLLWTATFTPADGSPATTFRWRMRLAD
jgi:hypothetical protein